MWRIAVLLIVVLSINLPIQAKAKKADQHEATQSINKGQTSIERRETFGPAERNLIRAHLLGQERVTVQQKHKNLPPGLQKNVVRGKALPPGWQKKVVSGRSLDYHVYQQGESLPELLLRRLPPSPVGSEIRRIEDKIIRLNSATRAILDVFDLTPTE